MQNLFIFIFQEELLFLKFKSESKILRNFRILLKQFMNNKDVEFGKQNRFRIKVIS